MSELDDYNPFLSGTQEDNSNPFEDSGEDFFGNEADKPTIQVCPFLLLFSCNIWLFGT